VDEVRFFLDLGPYWAVYNGLKIRRRLNYGKNDSLFLPGLFKLSYLVSVHKWSFFPISLSDSKNNPRNIGNMPVVIFIVLLDLGKKSSFVKRHYLSGHPER
jgi:hypothetical protein